MLGTDRQVGEDLRADVGDAVTGVGADLVVPLQLQHRRQRAAQQALPELLDLPQKIVPCNMSMGSFNTTVGNNQVLGWYLSILKILKPYILSVPGDG